MLHVSPGDWDSKVQIPPWVLKSGNDYMMYYRGSSEACKQDAIGLAATDADRLNFHKHSNNPIIRPANSMACSENPTAMGVLNAIRYEGNIMVFEKALESGYDQKGQIFGAKSNDGINFDPLNRGNPIFSARSAAG